MEERADEHTNGYGVETMTPVSSGADKNTKALTRRALYAEPTGLEPATSALTGQRSNQTELRFLVFNVRSVKNNKWT